jgi:hypothetical protein
MASIQALTAKETTSKTHMQVHTNVESREMQPGRKPEPNWAETESGMNTLAESGMNKRNISRKGMHALLNSIESQY